MPDHIDRDGIDAGPQPRPDVGTFGEKVLLHDDKTAVPNRESSRPADSLGPDGGEDTAIETLSTSPPA